jgi:addiction module RelB/DinJ family antitoxin
MAKTSILRTRVDSHHKEAAEVVLAKLGLSVGEAINLFLGQVGIQEGIPFPITARRRLDLSNASMDEIERRYVDRIPNETTRTALKEDTRKSPRYKSAGELLKALKS